MKKKTKKKPSASILMSRNGFKWFGMDLFGLRMEIVSNRQTIFLDQVEGIAVFS